MGKSRTNSTSSRRPPDDPGVPDPRRVQGIVAAVNGDVAPELMEQLAEAVHDAYLVTCDRLGWGVKPENRLPYSALTKDSQELDRASVRATLGALRAALNGKGADR